MSSNSFPKKWLQSSRGLPGSFMNENHHTMTHIWKEEANRSKGMAGENQTSASPTFMGQDKQHDDHQIQQSNDMDDLNLLGQEPQRSILGPHNDQYQCQQTNFPDDSDFSSRSKKNQHPPPITAMFPQDHLAGGLHKIDQDPPPHVHKNIPSEVTELGNDPDPATKAAFQSTHTKPIAEPGKPSSAAASVNSNHAIKSQPFVSNPIVDDDEKDMEDYDDDADYYTTSELMPATYLDNPKSSPESDLKFETPISATPFDEVDTSEAGKADMTARQAFGKDDGVLGQDITPGSIENADGVVTKTEKTAPFQASDMYHQLDQNITRSNAEVANTTDRIMVDIDKNPTNEENNPVGTNNNQQQQQQESMSSLRGDNTIQNSLGGFGNNYKNQETIKQPIPQNVSPNNQMPSQHSDSALPENNNVNPTNKLEGHHRRSSLTQSLGKLFGRHHKSS